MPRLRAEGIRTVEIPGLVRPPRRLRDLTTLLGLVRWMRRDRFAIVHCHSTKAGPLGRFAAWIAGVPGILFTVHGWSVRQEGLNGRVDFLGERTDIPQILSGADLFALSSR